MLNGGYSKQHRLMLYINIALVITLTGMCVFFFKEKTETAALLYLLRFDFPNISYLSKYEKMAFQIIKVFGCIVGGLSICRIMSVSKPKYSTCIYISVICILLMIVAVVLLKNRLVCNLIPALLLCAEAITLILINSYNSNE